MKVLINKIHQNYKDEICHEAWIQAQLASNLEIKIFDPDCLIPQECETKVIECLISLMVWEEAPYFTELSGKYLGRHRISSIEREKYIIPSYLKDLNIDKRNYFEGLYAFQTVEGIFFVEKDRFQGKEDEEIIIKAFRFDVFAWCPIQ